jgi:hypothetical protein
MTFPFELNLPQGIPGSFHIEQYGDKGTISYGLEVVADRQGMFNLNRRLGSVLRVLPPVLPPPSADLVTNLSQIQTLWNDDIKVKISCSKQVRRGFWGQYAEVKGEVHVPALQDRLNEVNSCHS